MTALLKVGAECEGGRRQPEDGCGRGGGMAVQRLPINPRPASHACNTCTDPHACNTRPAPHVNKKHVPPNVHAKCVLPQMRAEYALPRMHAKHAHPQTVAPTVMVLEGGFNLDQTARWDGA
eukprot:238930-Chlamydomonas_euryale.AAC.2